MLWVENGSESTEVTLECGLQRVLQSLPPQIPSAGGVALTLPAALQGRRSFRAGYFPLPCATVIADTLPLVSKSLPKANSTFAAAPAMPGTDTLGGVV